MFGTTAHEYCSNVYRVDLRTFESVKLFDSNDLLPQLFRDPEKFDREYPNEFLFGRLNKK